MRDQRGALLINLIVSMGILALLITVSIPFLRQYEPNLKLNNATRDLISDLRLAQYLSVTEQVPHAVEFDLGFDQYRVLRLPPAAATTTLKTVAFPVEVGFDSVTGLTANLVRYNPYGAVHEAGTIILSNTSLQIKTINLKPSGYVQLEE